MPLVVPGINSPDSNDKTMEWANKLMGKKLGDSSDSITFAQRDLPKETRVVKEGDMMSMDHKPERLNVHLGKDGTVNKVTHG